MLCADIRPKLSRSGWSEILAECVAIVRPKSDEMVAFLRRYEDDKKTPADPFPLHQAVRNADLTDVKVVIK